MAFGGNLEDLPFSDIIQLLHVSKKSGTLNVDGARGKAKIVCRDGFIIDATFPSDAVSIAALLLARDRIVTEEQLEDARAEIFPREDEGARMVAALIEAGHVSEEEGVAALRELIHQTLAEILTWKEGEFSFDADQLGFIGQRGEGTSVDLGPWSGVDTQGALMDAFRVFDEKNRSIEERKERKKERIKEAVAKISQMPSAPPGAAKAALLEDAPKELRDALFKDNQELDEKDLLCALEEMDDETLDRVLSPPTHAMFLCDDSFMKHSMHRLCRDNGIWATVSDLELDLKAALERGIVEGHSMVLVVDLGGESLDALGSQRRMAIAARMKDRNPELPLVFLGNPTETRHYLELFDLGARTVLPRPARPDDDITRAVEESKRFNDVILGCLNGIFREEYRLRLAVQENIGQMASLKKRVQEIQDRKTSPDISFIILQFIAEFLRRGIIFLVRKSDLLGLGSFGVSSHGDTISTAAMRIRIPLDTGSIFSEVVDEGVVYRGAAEDPVLRDCLHSHIGAPASAEFLLLPLKTENKTIALVYCDFGEKPASLIKTDALEILASQAGMAMEIALQRSRGDKAKPGPAPRVSVLADPIA
jgi:hypothetical protein